MQKKEYKGNKLLITLHSKHSFLMLILLRLILGRYKVSFLIFYFYTYGCMAFEWQQKDWPKILISTL